MATPALAKLFTAALIVAAAPQLAAQDIGTVLTRWDHDEHPGLRGVVVLWDGQPLAERYYNGATPEDLNDIRSAGKSITALLVGIAIDRGSIQSVDDPVARYWAAAADSAVGPVPLADVLTMRSGLDAFDDDPASPGNEDLMDASSDPRAFALAVPRGDPPGSRYRYNSVTAYVAGVVVAEATGMRMSDFAGLRLFTPLGITRWRWDADAAGVTKGQGNLWLATRGLAAIGEMVRNGGQSRGRRVVSAQWITDMLAPKVNIAADDPYADGYGYFWYRKEYRVADVRIPVSFASGNGGNKIYVVPTCRLVVAVTSSAYGHGYGQRRSEAILKAILDAQNATGGCKASDSASAAAQALPAR
ncbi:MAG TPA: serine hydrolase [Dokdonella sp.]|uniref:serine hydrolase domain-containing protein n=1 Tax=Dokdonella sp. TaxID=2291710 RepID=UPI002C3BB958|nr:serine hydrolase [Dokdonella sp.]HUD41156.1 serine hydrolase [Dokdonella sp.]